LFCISAEPEICPEAKYILGHQRAGKEESTRRPEEEYMKEGFMIRFLHYYESQRKKEDTG
jgi:hypothetical protein